MSYNYGDPVADAKTFLSYAGVQQTPDAIAAVAAWLTHENGANNNLLGVTHRVNNVSVLNTYATKEQGLQAAANLLKSSSNYTSAYQSLQAGKGSDFITQIAQSPWSSTHYGMPVSNALSGLYSQYGGKFTGNPVTAGGSGSGTTSYTDQIKSTAANTQSNFNPLGFVPDIPGAITTAAFFIGVIFIGVVLLGGGVYLAKR